MNAGRSVALARTRHLKLASAIACAWLMVAAGAAAAEAPSSGASAAAPATSAVDCSKSTLTGEKFMEMFHAIAMHGDLRDIPFIEKTLGVKFHSEHPHQSGSEALNVHRTIYSAIMPNAQFGIHLDVHDDKAPIPNGADIGIMRFNMPDNPSFAQCLHIIPSKFNSYFGGTFFATQSMGEMNGFLAEPLKGKDGSKINIANTYNWQDKIVLNAVMIQKPKTTKR